MPHPPSPGSVLSFSLGTPVIFSLVFGRVATLATGRLLKVVGLGATVVAQRVHLVAMLSKEWHSFCYPASATKAKETRKAFSLSISISLSLSPSPPLSLSLRFISLCLESGFSGGLPQNKSDPYKSVVNLQLLISCENKSITSLPK